MNRISKVFFIAVIISSSFSNFVIASDFSEKIDSITKENIGKADESIRNGVKKLFSPLQKGVGKLVNPYIEKNNAEYFFQLGQAYYSGNLYFNEKYIEQDFGKAIEAWENAAYNGSKQAPHNLGVMYYEGQGVPANKQKACEWFLKAALINDISSQYNVASCYYNGIGFEREYSQAFKWFLSAANQGNNNAQFRVAEMYFSGTGTDLDLNKATEWYKKSAVSGNAQAKSRLISLEKAANTPYKSLSIAETQGHVIDGDQQMASAVAAAQHGDANAQFEMGVTYFRGIGVVQDYFKALDWFNKADAQGHTRAKNYITLCYYELGVMYAEGKKVPENEDKAIEWFTKAAKSGNKNAQELLTELGVNY